MSEELVRTSESNKPAKPGTLAATFLLETLKKYMAVHEMTQRVLVVHLWNHHGDA